MSPQMHDFGDFVYWKRGCRGKSLSVEIVQIEK